MDIQDIIKNKIEVDLTKIKENSRLAFPLFDAAGECQIKERQPITKDLIEYYISRGITKLYYIRPVLEDEKDSDSLETYLEEQEYNGPRAISLETQKKSLKVVKKIFENIHNNKTIDAHEIEPVLEAILSDCNLNEGILINLLDVKNFDQYTYTHSINVGTLAMLFAQDLGYDMKSIFEIGMGGFLHDVGKSKISKEILNKPASLTDEEYNIIKKHPTLGYGIIKSNENLTTLMKKIVLHHHEKINGSGYPLGLKEEMIEKEIMIVGMSDYYDALTTTRPYKKTFTSKEALRIMRENFPGHFPQSLSNRFFEKVSHFFKESQFYPENSFVLLNTNEIGRIVVEDLKTIYYPVIEIISDSKGKRIKNPMRINLKQDYNRYVAYRIQ